MIKKKHIRLLKMFVLVLGLSNQVSSQYPSKLWYFGSNAGVDFKKVPAIATASPNVFGSESQTTLTDSSGNLLFYVSHNSVYNRAHLPMKNGSGLVANGGSSAQAPMILQNPANRDQFYIFQTADETDPNYQGNLRYSMVDMCGDNGFGEVMNGIKNRIIPGRFSERITAIPLQNGRAFWILVSELFRNTIHAYYLDANGISPTPVSSFFGNLYSAEVGFLVSNHKKTQLLYSSGLDAINNGVWLMDFDTLTGSASNSIQINSGAHCYGLAFSPNDQLIYYSYFYVFSGVVQYNILTGQVSVLTNLSGNYLFAALKEGPDQKIYVARPNQSNLDYIEFPDRAGFACNYRSNGFSLMPTGRCLLGLQNTEFYFKEKPRIVYDPGVLGPDTLLCDFDSIQLSIFHPAPTWSDGSTQQVLKITKEGRYWVSYYNCDTLFSDTIVIQKGIFTSKDTIYFCPGDSVMYKGNWYKDEISVQERVPNASGCDSIITTLIKKRTVQIPLAEQYWICPGDSIYIGGNWYRDSTTITAYKQDTNGCTYLSNSHIHLYEKPDSARHYVTLCQGDSILIRSKWYKDNAILPLHYLNANGCDSVFAIFIQVKKPPETLHLHFELCPGDSILINNQWIYQAQKIIYHKPVPGSCDSTFESTIDFFEPIVLDLENEIHLKECESKEILLNYSTNITSFRWYPGSGLSCQDCPHPMLHFPYLNKYYLEVKDIHGCSLLDSVELIIEKDENSVFLPNVFSPNGDQINDVFPGERFEHDFTLKIFSRWGELLFESSNISWDGRFQSKPMPPDTYVYLIELDLCNASQKFKGGVSLIR